MGRGLDALLGADSAPTAVATVPDVPASAIVMIDVSRITSNPYQPRRHFAPEALEELAASIEQNGILQPLVVRRAAAAGQFELVAGERRWRAAQRLALAEVPAIVREYTDREMLELALIENLQREELNAVEEARAYRRLIDEFGLTQEQVAERVGKSRVAVTNSLRLLRLSDRLLGWLDDGSLSAGHARALLGLDNEGLQLALAREIMTKELSVRETERRVRTLNQAPNPQPKAQTPTVDIDTADLEEKLTLHLGLQVKIHPRTNTTGRIEVFYSSLDEFSRVFDHLGISLEQEL
ncbi:MAG TPA: ParB/RepB/Spo0J family partition protein [Candidatus Sumerlaeota bacterium]|nr:ParB/RepB/Spo0J family partition protein [Candidatus Sumerlaeota bacterium]HOR28265.1 ParB/RepB/Spo0J family partition protein [Candidatus Sumerlaeota bacterium]